MPWCTSYCLHFAVISPRYYGQSHPTPNVSIENLKYLSSRQALEDVATFYEFFSQQYNLTSANKWVSFGGSYSGVCRIKRDNIHQPSSPYTSVFLPRCTISVVTSEAPRDCGWRCGNQWTCGGCVGFLPVPGGR